MTSEVWLFDHASENATDPFVWDMDFRKISPQVTISNKVNLIIQNKINNTAMIY